MARPSSIQITRLTVFVPHWGRYNQETLVLSCGQIALYNTDVGCFETFDTIGDVFAELLHADGPYTFGLTRGGVDDNVFAIHVGDLPTANDILGE